MKTAKILSLSFNPEKLKVRELTLRAHSFEVKSVLSPGHARYEIEMGQCGIFLTCVAVPDIVNQDLMNFFRRNCGEDGLIILVEGDEVVSKSSYATPADIRIPQSRDPEGIVEALQARQQSRKAGAD